MVTIKNVLSIDDEGIVAAVKDAHIDHVRFLFVKDQDGKIVITVRSSDVGGMKMRSMIFWTKRGFYLRTPAFLDSFGDKKMDLTIDVSASANDELFRMRPIDFDISGIVLHKVINPYFTNFNSLILSHGYLQYSNINPNDTLWLSHIITDSDMVLSGDVVLHIHKEFPDNASSMPLTTCSSGLRARGCRSLYNMVGALADYRYVKTVKWPKLEYGAMVFERLTND